MFMSDIGQNVVEEVSPVTIGANLGWNVWEGSYRYVSRAVMTESPRSDPKMTYPIVEWGQLDPVMLPNNSAASVSLLVYRSTAVPQLTNKILFGDMPSGEVFHVSADTLPKGGQDPIRRVVFVTDGRRRAALGAGDHQGEEPRARQAGSRARRPALRRQRGRTDLRAQQSRRRDSRAGKVTTAYGCWRFASQLTTTVIGAAFSSSSLRLTSTR